MFNIKVRFFSKKDRDDTDIMVDVVCKVLALIQIFDRVNEKNGLIALVLQLEEVPRNTKEFRLPYKYLRYHRKQKELQFQFVPMEMIVAPAFVVPNISSSHPGFYHRERKHKKKDIHLSWEYICIENNRISTTDIVLYSDFSHTSDIYGNLSLNYERDCDGQDDSEFNFGTFLSANNLRDLQNSMIKPFEEEDDLDQTLEGLNALEYSDDDDDFVDELSDDNSYHGRNNSEDEDNDD